MFYLIIPKIINSDKLKKEISKFSIKSIMSAKHMAEVSPEGSTQLKYHCHSNGNFCVLSDQSTVLGVNFIDKTTIFKETISDKSKPIIPFINNNFEVNTIQVDEENNMLFSGEDNYD